MDKEIVVCVYNKIILTIKEKEILQFATTGDAPLGHYAK